VKQQKIWAYFQNDGVDAFAQALPRYRFLTRRLARRTRAPASALNIGIGSGVLERMLVDEGFRVSALDPDATSVARVSGAGVDARVGAAEQLPFDSGTFDAIVASEVLEHLNAEESRAALKEISRALKPGGVFLGTVPYREQLAGNVVVCPDCGCRFHRWGHQQAFDGRSLAGLLQERFDVLHMSKRSFVQWTARPSRLLKSALRWVLGRAGEPIASPHLYFECRNRSY
jgi:SAM-dependent methyltransferase